MRLNHEDGIKILPNQDLRYITTKLFFREITSKIQNSNLDNNKSFQTFRSEITAYLGHLEQRASIQERNLKILSDIEDRKSLLMQRLEAVINAKAMNNNEVVPIYEIIKESRLSRFDICEILKSIAKTYAKRYIVTDRCLATRSKAKGLRHLLRNEPTYDDACISLTNNGLPMQCISEDLFEKLGFQGAFRSSDSTSFIKRKEPVQRSEIRVYHDDFKKVTVISVPKK